MKWLDLPPIWLAGFLVASWVIARALPGLTIEAVWLRVLVVVLQVVGLAFLALAVWQMSAARTTIVPHRQPSALVTGGVFRYSRNPIYLADLLFLTGAILWWGAVLALPLIPAFIWVINQRFILPEEVRLRAGFAEDFSKWCERTRRWL